MKKLKAATLAEFVIALSIIAICFSVATQVFMQTNRSVIQFREVKEQTEFQSLMLEALLRDTFPELKQWKGETSEIRTEKTRKDSVTCTDVTLFNNQKTIWQQPFYSE